MYYSAEDISWITTYLFVGLFAATSLLALTDRRQLEDVNVWAKPLKFQLSLALHFATLGMVCGLLTSEWRTASVLKTVLAAASLSALFEIVYIMIQAARRQQSHFNRGTPFLRKMYVLMAVGAVVITMAAGVVGTAVSLDKGAMLAPALSFGASYGLIAGTILTLIVAFRMGGALSHSVGKEVQGAPKMPLTGWSLTVGDRRVPHFFATHIMQFGPLAGWFFANFLKSGAYALTAVSVVAWTCIVLFTFQQANSGRPIISRFQGAR